MGRRRPSSVAPITGCWSAPSEHLRAGACGREEWCHDPRAGTRLGFFPTPSLSPLVPRGEVDVNSGAPTEGRAILALARRRPPNKAGMGASVRRAAPALDGPDDALTAGSRDRGFLPEAVRDTLRGTGHRTPRSGE
ncbi:hypothetical protein NDU88_007217 [Pleurodeles waltl]|uniref:Uncharacterized protein n=1 Tax=Pleurodeles waltl TaxID=8319 RepID=A0AAV7MMC7_PLEWA|nr:hypothetical protein NDU88_007217 [Pleurodeles waltl]